MSDAERKRTRLATWWQEAEEFPLWEGLYVAGTGKSPDAIPQEVHRFGGTIQSGIYVASALDKDGHFIPELRGCAISQRKTNLETGESDYKDSESFARLAFERGELPLKQRDSKCFLRSVVDSTKFFDWAANNHIIYAEKFLTGKYDIDGSETFEYWNVKDVWRLWEAYVLLHGKLPNRHYPLHYETDNAEYGSMHNQVMFVLYEDEGNLRGALDGKALEMWLKEAADTGVLPLLERGKRHIMESLVSPEAVIGWAKSKGVVIPDVIITERTEMKQPREEHSSVGLTGPETVEFNSLRELKDRLPNLIEAIVITVSEVAANGKAIREFEFKDKLTRKAGTRKIRTKEIDLAWKHLPQNFKHPGRPVGSLKSKVSKG